MEPADVKRQRGASSMDWGLQLEHAIVTLGMGTVDSTGFMRRTRGIFPGLPPGEREHIMLKSHDIWVQGVSFRIATATEQWAQIAHATEDGRIVLHYPSIGDIVDVFPESEDDNWHMGITVRSQHFARSESIPEEDLILTFSPKGKERPFYERNLKNDIIRIVRETLAGNPYAVGTEAVGTVTGDPHITLRITLGKLLGVEGRARRPDVAKIETWQFTLKISFAPEFLLKLSHKFCIFSYTGDPAPIIEFIGESGSSANLRQDELLHIIEAQTLLLNVLGSVPGTIAYEITADNRFFMDRWPVHSGHVSAQYYHPSLKQLAFTAAKRGANAEKRRMLEDFKRRNPDVESRICVECRTPRVTREHPGTGFALCAADACYKAFGERCKRHSK